MVYLACIEATRCEPWHTGHGIREVVTPALAIYNLEVVLTQSNSITHQALVVGLFRGDEVA